MKESDARPQRRALGRGLGALLESRTVAPPPAPPPALGLRLLPVEAVEPSPDQPRRGFTPESLHELAASIRQHGLLQPIVVSPGPGGKFRLVAGERRWRAARLAGLEQIPGLVQETHREQALELALIENLQREDLNPLEAAAAFERLSREFGLTHEEIARRTGKDRATITNSLRLLKLPAAVQQLLADGKLSLGHAKALLGAPTAGEQQRLAVEVVALDLSVRAAEKLVARAQEGVPSAKKARQPLPWDANTRAALQELERILGTRVRLSGNPKKGRLVIEYYSPEDLVRIYDAILKT